MFGLAVDYYLFVFVATVGIIQTSSSIGGFRGLLLITPASFALILGMVVATGAFIWFFAIENRNINDYEGGLDGPSQALYFFLGSLSGLLLTLIASSMRNFRLRRIDPDAHDGLDAMKHSNYIGAIVFNMCYRWKKWRD